MVAGASVGRWYIIPGAPSAGSLNILRPGSFSRWRLSAKCFVPCGDQWSDFMDGRGRKPRYLFRTQLSLRNDWTPGKWSV